MCALSFKQLDRLIVVWQCFNFVFIVSLFHSRRWHKRNQRHISYFFVLFCFLWNWWQVEPFYPFFVRRRAHFSVYYLYSLFYFVRHNTKYKLALAYLFLFRSHKYLRIFQTKKTAAGAAAKTTTSQRKEHKCHDLANRHMATRSRRTLTSRWRPWPFSPRWRRCFRLVAFTSSSWTSFPTTARTHRSGKTRYATICPSTTVSSKFHAATICQARAATGLSIPGRYTHTHAHEHSPLIY